MKKMELSTYLPLILVCEDLEPLYEKTKIFLFKKQMDRDLGVKF